MRNNPPKYANDNIFVRFIKTTFNGSGIHNALWDLWNSEEVLDVRVRIYNDYEMVQFRLRPWYNLLKGVVEDLLPIKTYNKFKKLPEAQQNFLICLISFILFILAHALVFFSIGSRSHGGWGDFTPDPNFHYDLWDEMFGPEEPEPTWWERIKFKIFGEPEEEPEPYRSWDEALEYFYNRWNVHQFHRDSIENVINPPEPPFFSKLKIEIRHGVKNLIDASWIWIKQTAIDTWNLSKFFVYYIDKNLRYVYDAIPISDSTWDYLALFGVSFCCLNYMYTLMRYDEVVYSPKSEYPEFQNVPQREIYFFHEYFLCWSTIIVCLLLFTQVK